MISHKYKCIFIHIPKSAGTSIDESFLDQPFVLWDPQKNLWLQHATAKQIRDFYCTKEEFREYFKFSIVRNPFDRIVSSYHGLCHWLQIPLSKETFKDFVLQAGEFRNLLDANKSCEKANRYHQIMPAVDYLFDQDTLLVDFVGRFENLKQDWKFVNEKLGTDIELLNLNRRPRRKLTIKRSGIHIPLPMPNIHKLFPKHYRKYYDDTTRKIIEDRYEKDLQIFGYTF